MFTWLTESRAIGCFQEALLKNWCSLEYSSEKSKTSESYV
jgi:hypothetical protein